MKQRTRIATIIASLSLLALALQVAAQPAAKPLRFLVGAPAGGSNDIFARAIGQRMSESIGQPVVVDNRPGASQMIAADLTAKALADGNTLYMTSTTYTTGAALMAKYRTLTVAGRAPDWAAFLASHATGTPTRFAPRAAAVKILADRRARHRRLVELHGRLESIEPQAGACG